jgi:hypothetical protein
VQLAFGTTCLALALPLIVQVGPAATVVNGTSLRILGGALLALAVGSFSSLKDPHEHIALMRVEIVFAATTAAFLLYRLLAHQSANDRAWLLLPPVAAGLALLLALYPRRPDRESQGAAESSAGTARPDARPHDAQPHAVAPPRERGAAG